MEVKINKDLLFAFAQLNDGHQFSKEELHCRIVPAQTDEGYEIQGKHCIEFYGVPKDVEWYKAATGRKTADIVFYNETITLEDSVDSLVTNFIVHKLRRKLKRARDHYEMLSEMLTPLNIK